MRGSATLKRLVQWGPRTALDLYRASPARRSKAPIKAKVPGREQIVYLRPNGTDSEVFKQIFLYREYDMSRFAQFRALSVRKPLVIDCGAHIGLATIWFAHQLPGAKIYAIEPDPENFDILRRNTEHLPDVELILGGVWDQPTRLAIIDPGAEKWVISLDETVDGSLPAVTIPQVIAQAGEHDTLVVKIDIEGGENALFRSNTGWVAAADVIVIELHDWMFPWRHTTRNCLTTLLQHEFDVICLGENLWFFKYPQTKASFT